MKTKLTLRLDDELIRRAKRYARRTGKSVSQMVADYFALLSPRGMEENPRYTPTVRSLKGILRGTDSDEKDYRRHLEEKYL
jgi:hypothetical protein